MTALCEVCDQPLPDEARHDRKYCGKKCAKRVRLDLKAEGLRAARSGRACVKCGGPISDDLKKGTKYCGPECRTTSSYERMLGRIGPRHCIVCGTAFQPTRPDHHHCSGECVWQTRRAEGKINRIKIKPRQCRCCGKTFQPKREKKGRFCSHACASAAMRSITAARFDAVWR